jgi:hypothetical protein
MVADVVPFTSSLRSMYGENAGAAAVDRAICATSALRAIGGTAP